MKYFFFFLLKFYKFFLNPLLISSCRFYPSCSDYIYYSILKYNVFFLLYLIIIRLLRCNFLFRGGYDPV